MRHSLLNNVRIPPLTGNITDDCLGILQTNEKYIIANHSVRVAETSRKIALLYNLDGKACRLAAYLHDIAGVVHPTAMLSYARQAEYVVYPAEERYPFLLHQRISALLASELFGITDERILSAISCHTTLKAHASPCDMVLFVADKLAWDKAEQPPFYHDVSYALTESLERACLCYMEYVLNNNMILYPHDWLLEAQEWLRQLLL